MAEPSFRSSATASLPGLSPQTALLTCDAVATAAERCAHFRIRHQVFVIEQGRLGGREMEAFIQPANVAFFRWLGWRRAGDLVDYAGIPHQRMLIDLTRP